MLPTTAPSSTIDRKSASATPQRTRGPRRGALILNVRYGTLTAVSDKGWVGWATENRLLVGAIALVTAVSLTIVAVVASNSGSSNKKKVASNSKVAAGTGAARGADSTETTPASRAVGAGDARQGPAG